MSSHNSEPSYSSGCNIVPAASGLCGFDLMLSHLCFLFPVTAWGNIAFNDLKGLHMQVYSGWSGEMWFCILVYCFPTGLLCICSMFPLWLCSSYLPGMFQIYFELFHGKRSEFLQRLRGSRRRFDPRIHNGRKELSVPHVFNTLLRQVVQTRSLSSEQLFAPTNHHSRERMCGGQIFLHVVVAITAGKTTRIPTWPWTFWLSSHEAIDKNH